MRTFDLILAAACVALAVRSAVHWLRRPLDSTAARDHALFALFWVCRVGAWLLLGAWFAGLATVWGLVEDETLGDRSVPEEIRARYGWIVVAFFSANAVAFLASYFLARGPVEPPTDAPSGG